jgi:mono/diheme cytochrome c family protein
MSPRTMLILALPFLLSAAELPSPPWEKPGAITRLGESLYRENCTVCHDIDKEQKSTRKLGPSLNHLFKNPRLPLSKGRPSRDYVKVRIQYGGQVMPAFMKRLNDGQIAALLAYLESK